MEPCLDVYRRSYDPHTKHLRNTSLSKLLNARSEKRFRAQPEVRFLDHLVTTDGVRPDPTKVLAIEALGLPICCTELRRKQLALPPTWRKVDGTVPWTAEESAAFFKLRDALEGPPILQHPDWEYPFELQTDASHRGLGAVLCQRINGQQYVIAYASRAIFKLEAPYLTWELEALAMIWATRLFRMYLTGFFSHKN
jgi:hypothetical protein